MDAAEGPSSATLAARLGGRRTIGLGGSEGQRWAGSGETSTFRFVSLLRTPGSPRTEGTALGRFVRSPPETESVDGEELGELGLGGHRHVGVEAEAKVGLGGASCVQK